MKTQGILNLHFLCQITPAQKDAEQGILRPSTSHYPQIPLHSNSEKSGTSVYTLLGRSFFQNEDGNRATQAWCLCTSNGLSDPHTFLPFPRGGVINHELNSRPAGVLSLSLHSISLQPGPLRGSPPPFYPLSTLGQKRKWGTGETRGYEAGRGSSQVRAQRALAWVH